MTRRDGLSYQIRNSDPELARAAVRRAEFDEVKDGLSDDSISIRFGPPDVRAYGLDDDGRPRRRCQVFLKHGGQVQALQALNFTDTAEFVEGALELIFSQTTTSSVQGEGDTK